MVGAGAGFAIYTPWTIVVPPLLEARAPLPARRFAAFAMCYKLVYVTNNTR